MTALYDLLAARIAASGPITLADYMADCLLHPQYGYYATRDPFGAGGLCSGIGWQTPALPE